MTENAKQATNKDPERSIFLFHSPLSVAEHGREMFALMQQRGNYRGLSFDEQEEVARELDLRRNVTLRLGARAIEA